MSHRHPWLFALLLSSACSGNATDDGKAVEDPCSEGETSTCEVDGQPGSRTCQITEFGFAWGACAITEPPTTTQPDTCKAGDTMHCFPEGSAMRAQFGDMIATCQLVDGRWSYPLQSCATPLVLSFDGAAVQFTQASGHFDLFGLDMSVGTDWVSARTPWLVLDRDQDGSIADGGELFGSMTVLPSGGRASNGFEALSALDANADGWVTEADENFDQLKLWFDLDQDRRSSPSELQPLSTARVEAIGLSYRLAPRCHTSGCELERARFVFRDADGTQREGAVIDVHLRGF